MQLAADSAIRRAALEIEGHVASEGWDQSPRLFALVLTSHLVEQDPGVAEQLELDAAPAPDALTPVEQEELSTERPFEETLQGIMWPPQVTGCAAVIERLMLPPEAEDALPDDDDGVASYAAEHPERQDVRIVVAVTRAGDTHCTVRVRAHDGDLMEGPDLVPGLARLLSATLAD